MKQADIWVEALKGIGALAALILWGIGKEWWKERQEAQKKAKYKNTHTPEKVAEIKRLVLHETRKIRDRFQAMRCYVIQLSNGSSFESGLPQFKITFMHEAYIGWGQHPVKPASTYFQGVDMPPMFNVPMAVTFRVGEYYLKNKNTLDLMNENQRDYFHWLDSHGVGSSMWLAIYKNGKPAAIMVIHWPQPTDLKGTLISDIKDIKRNIEKVYATI